ncbi:MAG: NAD(P)/FAD-dependent oxidoreductase [Nocardioidaceae bacterium]
MTSPADAFLTRVAWDDDPALPDWAGLPSLDGDVTADVCVIGLGGSGLAAVEELVDRGLDVVGLDAGRVAAGAAGRNGGILSAGGAMPKHGQHVVSLQLRQELYQATLAELARLSDQLGPEVIRSTGSLRIAGLPGAPENQAQEAEQARELRVLQDEAAVLRSWGVAVTDYDGDLGRGYFNPDTSAMNPVHRALGLASCLAGRSRLYEHTRVLRVRAGSVETRRGRVQAPVIVVAVDGKLCQLFPQLGSFMRTVRLQMAGTAPVAERLLTCPASFRLGYEWAQQDSEGRLLLGGGRDKVGDDEYTCEDSPTGPVQSWIDTVVERLVGRPVAVTHRWAASVDYTEDQRAAVLIVDDGVAVCGGYSGSGNLVGPVAARAAVALALDGTTPPAYFRTSL